MAKRYYRLMIGKPNINGEIVSADITKEPNARLEDYISSYTNPQDNLSFEVITAKRNGDVIYQVVCPRMKFISGGGPTAASPSTPAGWHRQKKDIVALCLTSEGELRPARGNKLKAYIEEISASTAAKAKKDEFYYSMQQLWIAGA